MDSGGHCECRLNFKNRPVRTFGGAESQGGGPEWNGGNPPLPLKGVAIWSLPLIGLKGRQLAEGAALGWRVSICWRFAPELCGIWIPVRGGTLVMGRSSSAPGRGRHIWASKNWGDFSAWSDMRRRPCIPTSLPLLYRQLLAKKTVGYLGWPQMTFRGVTWVINSDLRRHNPEWMETIRCVKEILENLFIDL